MVFVVCFSESIVVEDPRPRALVLWVRARVVLGVGVVVEGVPCVTARLLCPRSPYVGFLAIRDARVRVRACALCVCSGRMGACAWVCVCALGVGVCGYAGAPHPGLLAGRGGGGRVAFVWLCCGGVLLSHDLSIAVPLALPGLASRFGMLLGVSPVL